MRIYKEKPEDTQNEELNEISNTNYGLELVEEGCDFAEGDKNQSPQCGGL
ncbi:hypothetical protein [Cytobacillus sp. NCCP-133]|nr:hypothetical protein [Cytobacillus sp. NCCP-133]GLB61629.1 hypothetical protein NCCP133_37580 [Cytobacillus sp. NCCP-133]